MNNYYVLDLYCSWKKNFNLNSEQADKITKRGFMELRGTKTLKVKGGFRIDRDWNDDCKRLNSYYN